MHDELRVRRERSRYRQLRITGTLLTTGRFDYSVHAKPLNLAWDEKALLLRGHLYPVPPLQTPDDCYQTLIDVLREQTLPGL